MLNLVRNRKDFPFSSTAAACFRPSNARRKTVFFGVRARKTEDRLTTFRKPSPKGIKLASEIPFVVDRTYTRGDIYEILNVPEEKRRGNWETGYTRWGDDLYMFPTVGSPGTGGFDYDNGWEGDIFRWYAKNDTTIKQPLIKWILEEANRVFIFTRPRVRTPFTFQGLGTPHSFEDQSPVLIRWLVNRLVEESFEVLPTEESGPAKFIEGATKSILVNAYERNQKARQACINHYGFDCSVCGFNFSSHYGDIGQKFIHVHHLRDLASVGCEYEVNPIDDLRPVCPNCHAMLHVEKPPMSIESLRKIIESNRSKE